MPLSRFIPLLATVLTAALATVAAGRFLARLSEFHTLMMLDGARALLALVVVFLSLRVLFALIRQ